MSAPAIRVGMSKRLRFDVFKRDGFRCVYCGATPQAALLECDHVDPVSNGGSNEIDNLVTACFPCNRGKSDKLLSDLPQSMADRAAETIEREAQIAGYQDILKRKRLRIDADVQQVIDALCDAFNDGVLKRDVPSIRRFVEVLGLHDCLEAVSKAEYKSRTYYQGWKYFCGVCWGKIRDQEGSNCP